MRPSDYITARLPQSPDFLAGVATGLTLAGKAAESLGALVNDSCQCEACRSANPADRDRMAAVFEANRMFAADMANAYDGMAADVMMVARRVGYQPRTRYDK